MNVELKDFLTFEKMVTPVIIQVIYWIGLFFAILAGLIAFFGGLFGGGFQLLFVGLLWLIIGPLVVRVYCELLIVIFRIYDKLKEINQSLQPQERP